MLALAVVLMASCQRAPEETAVTPAAPQKEEAAVQQVQLKQMNLYLEEDLAQDLELALGTGSMLTKAEGFNAALEQLDVVSMERLFPYAGEFEPRTRKAGLHRWYIVRYRADLPATKAEGSLADLPGVVTVEPQRRFRQHGNPVFNDPQFPRQWDLLNEGKSQGMVAGADVNVVPVWNNITAGDPQVVVAVVDGGVDFSHEDLAGRVNLANSHNFVNGTGDIEPTEHGTHVGGTIAAAGNNGKGIAGVAGGDAVAGRAGTTLISCQVFTEEGSAQDFSAAIKWAADHGAVIVNNSWSFDYWNDDYTIFDLERAKRDHEFYLQPNEGQYHSSMKDAIDYFNANAGLDKEGRQVGPMAGGLVVFSAGNESLEYCAPSCYPGVLAVGATNAGGRPANYSNYGDWVDIAAPGGEGSLGILSTLPGNTYGNLQGTSMASPHVCGVAALVVAACGGIGFTRDMLVEKLLKGTSSRINLSSYHIGPLVDAWNAINYGDTTPPAQVTTLAVEPLSNSIIASWKVTGHANIPAAGFLVHYSASKANLEASTPTERKEGVFEAFYGLGSERIGDQVSLTLKDLEFKTEYFVRVYAYNTNRIYSEPSATVSATTTVNNPPQISTDADLSNLRIKASETRSILFNIVDPDGHEVFVTYTAGSEGDTWRANPDGTYAMQITGPKAAAGTYKAHILVKDAYGASDQAEVKYTILENHGPTMKKQFENQLLTTQGASFSMNLSDYFTDEDGDVLTYSATNTSGSAIHVTTSSGKISGTAISNGLATISVTAKDPLGKSVSTEFKVAVRTGDVVVSAYPNPVTDYLYISNREANAQSMKVRMVNATGGVVFDASVTGSAFEPAVIDCTKLAPGVYSVTITLGGNDYVQTVVKK